MATTPYTVSASRFTRNADGTLACEASDLALNAMPTTIVVVGTSTNNDLPVRSTYAHSRTRIDREGEVWCWEYTNSHGVKLVIFND